MCLSHEGQSVASYIRRLSTIISWTPEVHTAGPLEMIAYLELKVYLWCEQVSHSKVVISSNNGNNIFLNPCIASIPATTDLLNKHQGDWERRLTNEKSHSSFPFDY